MSRSTGAGAGGRAGAGAGGGGGAGERLRSIASHSLKRAAQMLVRLRY